MCDFCMAALMLLTGHGIKARTHTHTEIARFPMWCINRAWEARGCRLGAFQVLMMHRVGMCSGYNNGEFYEWDTHR